MIVVQIEALTTFIWVECGDRNKPQSGDKI